VAVKLVGQETFRLCQQFLDEIVRVDTDAICAAIKDVFEDTRSILEPAGALAIAGAKAWAEREGLSGKTLVAIASGANMNFDRLRHVAERAEVGEQREVLLAVKIPEQPGSFRNMCKLLGSRFVTEFNYRYADKREAVFLCGLQVNHRSEGEDIVAQLNASGLSAFNLTHNELAKTHIRHLAGGHAPHVENERLLRFEFPERPGALTNFLERMNLNWNISLFHYRHHGADYGRVLVGIQVPPQEDAEFAQFLKQLRYEYVEETGNPAYRLFLG
jgi:threonine dehydratase